MIIDDRPKLAKNGCTREIRNEHNPEPVHNEPVIYQGILFAQKAQVSAAAKHQKGNSCNPRGCRAWERRTAAARSFHALKHYWCLLTT